MLAVMLLGLPRLPEWLEAWRQRLRAPRFRSDVLWAVPLSVACFALVHRLAGKRFADEAWELSLVAVVASAWIATRRAPDETVRRGRGVP